MDIDGDPNYLDPDDITDGEFCDEDVPMCSPKFQPQQINEELEGIKNASKILGLMVHDTKKLRTVDESKLDSLLEKMFGKDTDTPTVTTEDIAESMSNVDIQSQLDSGVPIESIETSVKNSLKFNLRLKQHETKWKQEEEGIRVSHVFDNLSEKDDSVFLSALSCAVNETANILSNVFVIFMSSPHKTILSKISDEIFKSVREIKNLPHDTPVSRVSINSIIQDMTKKMFYDEKEEGEVGPSYKSPLHFDSSKNIFLSSLLLRSLYTGFDVSDFDENTKGDEFVKDLTLRHNKKMIDLNLFPITFETLSKKIHKTMISGFGDNFWELQLLKTIMGMKKSIASSNTKNLIVLVDNVQSKSEIELIASHGATCFYVYIDPVSPLIKYVECEKYMFDEQNIKIDDVISILNRLDNFILADIMKLESKGKTFKRKVPKIENYEYWIQEELKQWSTPTEFSIGDVPKKPIDMKPKRIIFNEWKDVHLKHYMRENYSTEFMEHNKKNKIKILYNRVLMSEKEESPELYNKYSRGICAWLDQTIKNFSQ